MLVSRRNNRTFSQLSLVDSGRMTSLASVAMKEIIHFVVEISLKRSVLTHLGRTSGLMLEHLITTSVTHFHSVSRVLLIVTNVQCQFFLQRSIQHLWSYTAGSIVCGYRLCIITKMSQQAHASFRFVQNEEGIFGRHPPIASLDFPRTRKPSERCRSVGVLERIFLNWTWIRFLYPTPRSDLSNLLCRACSISHGQCHRGVWCLNTKNVRCRSLCS